MKESRNRPAPEGLLREIYCSLSVPCRYLYRRPKAVSPGHRVPRLQYRLSQNTGCRVSDRYEWFLPICRKVRHVTNQVLLLYISCPLETVDARYDTNVVIKLTSSYNFKFPCRNSAAIWLRPGIGRVAACGKSSSRQSAGLMSG